MSGVSIWPRDRHWGNIFKAHLLVLKTKKYGFSRFLTSFNFLDAYIFYTYLCQIKNDKKNHVIQKLIAMRNSDSLFLYTNIYMLKIHENNKKIVWESD